MSQAHTSVVRLKRRSDFLRAAKGDRIHGTSFTLQAAAPTSAATPAPNAPENSSGLQPRFGITVTKRIGGAVERNRIRRRLKEALRLSADLPAQPGRDYVIVAKNDALTVSFQALQAELYSALRRSNRPARPKATVGKTAATKTAGRKPGSRKAAGAYP